MYFRCSWNMLLIVFINLKPERGGKESFKWQEKAVLQRKHQKGVGSSIFCTEISINSSKSSALWPLNSSSHQKNGRMCIKSIPYFCLKKCKYKILFWLCVLFYIPCTIVYYVSGTDIWSICSSTSVRPCLHGKCLYPEDSIWSPGLHRIVASVSTTSM